MNKISKYLHFIKKKGKPLSGINPGSSEFALHVDDAFLAIELLKDAESPIVGEASYLNILANLYMLMNIGEINLFI